MRQAPFARLFTPIAGGPLADAGDEHIRFIARNYGWINGHGGAWLEGEESAFFAGPSAGRDADGRTVGERLRALNPSILLTNYRNGAYVNQGALGEAGEAERRAPLAIAVHDTGARLAAAIGAEQTTIEACPASGAPAERARVPEPLARSLDTYPFKPSTTSEAHSIDKSRYVGWLRLGEEILRIERGAAGRDGRVRLSVARGVWGTRASTHESGAPVLQPIYCGSASADGREYYLSGLLDGNSAQRALRYIMEQDRPEFWEFLGDKTECILAEGYDGPWYDCACSSWINHANAFGVRVDGPYDFALNRSLRLDQPEDRDRFLERQQGKIDAIQRRFPQCRIFVNWFFPSHYFANGTERRLFSGEGGHRPIAGGAIEMHANEKFMDWRELMAMQIDLRDSGFRIACWAKRADSGSEWRMPIEYLLFSYCSFLLTYEPRSPHYWGGNWGQGWSSRSPFAPPAFVYADLGAPRERFAEIDQALWLGSSGIFARRYEKGLIAVNASKSDSAGLRLEQPLYDVVAEQWVEKTELKPLSARLLLSRQMPLRH